MRCPPSTSATTRLFTTSHTMPCSVAFPRQPELHPLWRSALLIPQMHLYSQAIVPLVRPWAGHPPPSLRLLATGPYSPCQVARCLAREP